MYVIYSVCMIICLFIKSGLDNNISSLSVCVGGDPMAMALYNDAFMILIPPALCDTTFVEFYF